MTFVEVVDRHESPRPYPIPLTSVISGYVILFGYSLKESTGAASAEVDIFDGRDTTGLLALPITLAAAQSTEDWFGPQGIHFRGGLFPHVASGSVVGSFFVHLTNDERWK